jgi:phage terminase small subunit
VSKKALKRVKAGTSKAAAEARKDLFIAAYISNGCNATQAARSVGFAPKAAEQAGMRLKRDVRVRAAIAAATERAAKIAGLEVARTLREVARVAYSDPRKLFDKEGELLPVPDLDDDTAATVASIEQLEEYEGTGESRKLVGYTKKLKIWDKNAALEKAMKFHGLYERDNAQLGEAMAKCMVYVPEKKGARAGGS